MTTANITTQSRVFSNRQDAEKILTLLAEWNNPRIIEHNRGYDDTVYYVATDTGVLSVNGFFS